MKTYTDAILRTKSLGLCVIVVRYVQFVTTVFYCMYVCMNCKQCTQSRLTNVFKA